MALKGISPLEAQVTRGELAYKELKRAVVSGDLEPGADLGEEELAETLNVSRAVVRAAIQRLHVDGYLDYTPFKGASVIKPTRPDVLQRVAVRTVLEIEAVRQARRNPQAIVRATNSLNELADRIRLNGAGDPQKHAELDLELHRLIWQLAENDVLYTYLNMVTAPLFASACLEYSRLCTKAGCANDPEAHKRLVDAICAEPGELNDARAEEEMRKHIFAAWNE